MESKTTELRRTRRIFLFVCLPISLIVFWYSYQDSNGELMRPIKNALAVFAFLGYVVLLYQRRRERRAYGLSNEQYILKEAGSPVELLDQSVTLRAIGWLCIFVPTVILLVVAMATKSLGPVLIVLAVTVPICAPCAYACFHFSAKYRRVAEQAGAKIW